MESAYFMAAKVMDTVAKKGENCGAGATSGMKTVDSGNLCMVLQPKQL